MVANRNGNIACTQGGESMAGLRQAVRSGIAGAADVGIVDSTAHMLKFISFQDMYFQDSFGPEFGIRARPELKNAPLLIRPEGVRRFPAPGKPLVGQEMTQFVETTATEIARVLGLERRS
jgi:threonine synthase